MTEPTETQSLRHRYRAISESGIYMPAGICSRRRFQSPKPLRMPMAATPTNKPTGDDRNLVPVDEKYAALTFEDKLHQFWARNRMLVLGLCGLVLVGILAKGGWERWQGGKE